MKIAVSVLSALLILSSFSYAAECLPARVEKDFPAELANGHYIRFSPKGDMVLVYADNPQGTGLGKTYLVDLRGNAPKSIVAPVAPEAYPSEGDWDVIGSPDLGGGSSYYETSALLKNKLFTGSAFGTGVGGLYQCAGTLPGGTENKKIIRTVAYGKMKFSDVEIEVKNGKVTSSKEIKRNSKYLCNNLGDSSDVGPELMMLMISKDGKMASGMNYKTGNKLALLHINDDLTCTMEPLPISAQKVMFSHPMKDRNDYVAFQGMAEIGGKPISYGQVSIMDLKTKAFLRVDEPTDQIVSYSPGTLKDGRVAFIRSTPNGGAKLVIVDPWQVNPKTAANCLRKDSNDESGKTPSANR